MARSPRITNSGEPTVYHLMSRTTLVGYPLGDAEKDYFVSLIRKFSRIYFVEVLGYCCMGNHFHLLVRMLPGQDYSDKAIRERFRYCYGRQRKLLDGQIPYFRDKWADLSRFMKDVKLAFTRYYNQVHDHKGYFWGDRFKSVIVESGDALLNCLAYIDLNPVRAGLVKRPEDYRWSSIGWHVQTGNKDRFLSSTFGLEAYDLVTIPERIAKYRRFLYETGMLERETGATLDSGLVETEKKSDFQLSRTTLFRYRSKYFTDSGIIGSKEYVNRLYRAVKHRLPGKREKIPHQITGLDDLFSMRKFKQNQSAMPS